VIYLTKNGIHVRFKYWVLVAILFFSRLFSQAILEGIIKESGSGRPVQYVSIAVLVANSDSIITGGVTDKNGEFHIPNVSKGIYFLEIDFIGFKNIQTESFVVANEEESEINMGEYILEPVILELDAVNVSADKPKIRSDVAKTVYDADRLYSATGGTCCDIMKSIPLVDVAANGQVSLRGSPEVAILINGKRAGILGSARRTNIMSVPVPASIVDKVEVITNPSAKLDADGMVGVINIILKENQEHGLNGHMNVNLGNTEKSNLGAYFNFRKGRINHFWNISTEDLRQSGSSYRRSELVSQTGQVSDQALRTVNTIVHNQTLYLSGGSRYNLSDQTIINAEVKFIPFQRRKGESIDMDDQYFDIKKDEDGFLRLLDLGFLSESKRNYRVSIGMTLELQNWKENQLGKERNSIMDLSIDGKTNLDRRILDLEYENEITPSFKVEAGAKERQLAHMQPRSLLIQSGDTVYATDFTYDEQIRAAYLNMEYTTFMEDIVFIGGARIEDVQTESNTSLDSVIYHLSGLQESLIPDEKNYLTQYSKWYPSFLVRYRPDPYTTFQTGYSARVNRPTANLVDPLPQNLFEFSVIQIGNPDLKPEFIHSYELRLSQIKSAWNWEVALFKQQIKNVIREDEDLLDSISVITWKNARSGTNVGMDFRIKFKPLPFWDLTMTGLYYNTQTDHTNENDLSGTLSGFQGRLNQIFTIRGGGKLELDSRFFSPEKIPTGTVHPNGLANINLTFRKNLLDDRIELSFKILDAFNNEERRSETSEIELIDQVEYVRKLNSFTKPDRRTYYLNMRYKFGISGKKQITKKTRESKGYRY